MEVNSILIVFSVVFFCLVGTAIAETVSIPVLGSNPSVTSSKSSNACTDTGPPYFLITFHDTPRNVAKFTIQGCYLGLVLVANPSLTNDTEFRGMAIHDDGLLFIAQTAGSNDMDSSVAIYSTCQESLGPIRNRMFKSTAISASLNPGLVHPYDVAIESRSNPLNPHVVCSSLFFLLSSKTRTNSLILVCLLAALRDFPTY